MGKISGFPSDHAAQRPDSSSSVRVVREVSVSPGFPHVGLSYVFSAAPHTFRSQSATGHDPIAPVPGPDSNPRASPRRGASSTRQKGAEHWPPPNVPEPLGHRSPRAPSGPVPQSLPDPLQCCSSRAERLCEGVRGISPACDASLASPANGRIHFVRHLRPDILPCARPLRAKRPWRTSCSALIPGLGHAILSTNELKMPTSLIRAGNTIFLYPHTVIYCLWRQNLLYLYINICTFPDIVLLVQIASMYAKISTK